MILFKLFIWFTFFFAATVIFSSTPIYSILSLICIILGGCFFLFLLKIEFLSFIILLLYIGAIAILFLFVVMMVQPTYVQSQKLNIGGLSSSAILYTAFVVKVLYFIMYFNYQLTNTLTFFSYQFLSISSIINYTFIQNLRISGDSVIFVSIFTQKYYLFVLIAIILLFAMIGSIVLCLQEKNE